MAQVRKLKRALTIQKSTKYFSGSDIAQTRFYLGQVYDDLGDHKKALHNITEAQRLWTSHYKRIFHPEYRRVSLCLLKHRFANSQEYAYFY
jgi:hypothetical protein